MLVFPVRIYPCGICTTRVGMGGEGCGRGEKFAGAPLPPKKSDLTYTRCCARGGNWLICIARNVQTYEGSRSNSHGLENPLTRVGVV